MAGKSQSMFRINQLSKDLGVKSKDLSQTLETIGVTGKSTSAVLEPDDVNLLFEHLTKNSQIKDIDSYLSGKTSIKVPDSPEQEEKKKAEAAKKEAAENAARAKAEAERKAAEEKAAAERAAREKAEAERRAAEKAAREKAEAERKAAEEKAANERAAREKAEAERKAAEERAASERAAREKAEAERKAAEEKAANERIAKEKAEAEKAAKAREEQEKRAAEEKAEVNNKPVTENNNSNNNAASGSNTNTNANAGGSNQNQRSNNYNNNGQRTYNRDNNGGYNRDNNGGQRTYNRDNNNGANSNGQRTYNRDNNGGYNRDNNNGGQRTYNRDNNNNGANTNGQRPAYNNNGYNRDNNNGGYNRDNNGGQRTYNRDFSNNGQRPSYNRDNNGASGTIAPKSNGPVFTKDGFTYENGTGPNNNNQNKGGFNKDHRNSSHNNNNSFRGGDKDKDYGNDRAPIQPQPKPKIETGVEKKRTGNVRVVDTRTSSVDLSKYDERLEKFTTVENENDSNKQKLKKQNQRPEVRGTGKKNNKEKLAMDKLRKANLEKAKKQPLKVTIPDEITVSELASRLKVTAAEVVKRLMLLGVMASVNQVIDYDTAALISEELGAVVTREVKVTIEDKLFNDVESDDGENDVPRAPVVCVMGHVDHGKTSILDAIRKTNVTSGEAGGITQAIGAYRVEVNGKPITFLDTPGHEAFTAMRARGAQATDIAILVVAADDGIMPQTVESINHAKAAGVDIIVAINKMDKPTANPDQVKNELTKYDLVPEEWGGDVMCVPVSALTGQGINDLLESILLVAEVKEYKANPAKRAKGVVIEAKLDKGRGPVATILVQNGTLRAGDIVIAGTAVGRVRAMANDKGEQLTEAGPSVPVEIIGLDEVPVAGDELNAVEDERMARELADQRKANAKEDEFKLNAKVSLDELFTQIKEGVQELNIIVKADVMGSAEAVKASLEKISTDEVKVKVIHSAAGGITEGDVMFAAASNAIIVGFNVRPDKAALDSAERQNVDIRTYRIIYECIEEIQAAMKGMLAPEYKEVIVGHIEVRQTIRVPGVGIIAGSYVKDGKVTRQSSIRILRDSVVIMEDKITSLKRFKDDAKEVAAGYECGIGFEKASDVQVGDILEAYVMEEITK